MFDQLVEPTSQTQHMAAAEFFMSLKKEAKVRTEARQMIRRVADTNPLPSNVATPKPPAAKPAGISVQKTISAPEAKPSLQKQAFIGEALRAVAHAGQGPAASAVAAAKKGIGSLGKGLKQMGNRASTYRQGFKAGYTMKDPNFMQELFSRFRKGSGFGKMQEGRFIPIKSRVIIGRKTTPGSDAFIERLSRTKGKDYAEAFRAGREVRKGVDPDTLAGGARHFVTSKGDITPASILKGVHTIGLVNPETTQGAIRSLMKSRGVKKSPSLSKMTGLSNTQLALGGGTAAGLGYLALRPKKPQE